LELRDVAAALRREARAFDVLRELLGFMHGTRLMIEQPNDPIVVVDRLTAGRYVRGEDGDEARDYRNTSTAVRS
jgi:hypothetical protein